MNSQERTTHIPLDDTGAAPDAATPAAEVARRGLALRSEQCARLARGIDGLAVACVDLAERVAAGGTLFVLGSGSALPDARHLALEFLHPVIVGKRAVPALAVDPTREPCDEDRLGAPGDAVIAVVGADATSATWRALETARARGLLTLALSSDATRAAAAADHVLDPGARDPRLVKEGRVVLYHLLWELTHVMLEESERLPAGDAAEEAGTDAGLGALYPFLGGARGSGDALRSDLCASGVAKLRTLETLRCDTIERHAAALEACGAALRRARASGAQLLSFGNGGSQTDADWLAAWLGGAHRARPWRSRSLAGDPSVLSALANDVGFERVFARQVAAFGRAGDVALGISTSGSSANVVHGLAEAKRRGLLAIGLAGGDGGRLAEEGSVDFLFVVPSPSVHRIQEVQATLYHLLDELSADDAERGGPPCAS